MITWVLVAMQVATSHPPLAPDEAVRVLRASRSTADRTDAPPPLPDGPTVTFIWSSVTDGPFGPIRITEERRYGLHLSTQGTFGLVGQVQKRWRVAVRSSKSARKQDAINLLRLREGDTAKGIPVTSQVNRLKYDEALDDLLTHHRVNGRDTSKMEARINKHLTPFFAGRKMADITVALVNKYVAHRQAQVTVIPARTINRRSGMVVVPERRKPVATATINRELAWLKHMFSLATDAGKLMTKPRIKLLDENNVRQGFIDPEQLGDVLSKLPDDLRPLVEFAYITGWRKSEVVSLEWRQVDFTAGEVRLEPGTTKNKEGRTFPFTARLRALLEAQRAEADRLKKRGHIVARVFFRMVAKGRGGPLHPVPITSFEKAFKAACVAAGLPGRTPHDMRRSAVRNLERAGVPRSVAMKLTGHKTESVYRRYDIVSPNDLRVAVERLDRRVG